MLNSTVRSVFPPKPQINDENIGDDSLAILCVIERHQKLTDREVITMTQRLTRHCLQHVIDRMFPDGVTAKNFEPRQYEFQKQYRKMLRDYAQGTFDLPEEKPAASPVRQP